MYFLDIGRMYQLVARSQYGLLEMRDILQKHIIRRGNDALAAVVELSVSNVSIVSSQNVEMTL